METVLLLVDVQALWNSCCAKYGKRARVNFKTLLDKSKSKRTDVVRAVAYVVFSEQKKHETVVKKLDEMGFVVVGVESNDEVDFSQDMNTLLSDAESMKDFDAVVIAGCNANILTVIDAANQANKRTTIIGFGSEVTKELAQAADNVRIFTKKDTITQ